MPAARAANALAFAILAACAGAAQAQSLGLNVDRAGSRPPCNTAIAFTCDDTARSYASSVALVGRAPLSSTFGVWGKLGAVQNRPELPGLAAPESGLSFGAGVSYSFSPRLSATLGLESAELRTLGPREPLRSANMGLQYRY